MNPQHFVLFLCSGNYYRSRYAEWRFLTRVAPNSGWSAVSRGLQLSPGNVGLVASEVIARYRELGIPFPAPLRPPVQFTPEEVLRADRIVALNEEEHRPLVERLMPEAAGKVVYWHVPDIEFLPANQALPLIEREVDDLIRTLDAPHHPSTE